MANLLRRLAILAVSAVAVAITASAQSTTLTSNWAGLNRVAPGAELRVTVAGGRILRGSLVSASADSLMIQTSTGQETLARPDVKRIQLKSPGHRGRNTLIGLAAGAGGGLAVGAGADSSSGDRLFPNAGKVIFAAFGGVVGTVVGLVIPTGRWHDVYHAS